MCSLLNLLRHLLQRGVFLCLNMRPRVTQILFIFYGLCVYVCVRVCMCVCVCVRARANADPLQFLHLALALLQLETRV